MTIRTMHYSLLRAFSDELRGESLNVGLIAFGSNGPRVVIASPISRLRALHPNFAAIDPLSWSAELESVLREFTSIEEQLRHAQIVGGAIRCDALLGRIELGENDSEEEAIQKILYRFVEVPEKTVVIEKAARQQGSRLQSQLKSWFRRAKLFSSNASDLANRKVVSDFPVVAEDDLFADFALKNGSIHIIETLDLRGLERVTKSSQGQASLKAILLDQARTRLPSTSRRIAVIAADDYSQVRSSVNILSHYADDVVQIESAADQQRFASFIAESLHVKQVLPSISTS